MVSNIQNTIHEKKYSLVFQTAINNNKDVILC